MEQRGWEIVTEQPTKRPPGRPKKKRTGARMNLYLPYSVLAILDQMDNKSEYVAQAVIEKYKREGLKARADGEGKG